MLSRWCSAMKEARCASYWKHVCSEFVCMYRQGEGALPCAIFCSASPAGKLLVPAAKVWVPAVMAWVPTVKAWVPTGKLWVPVGKIWVPAGKLWVLYSGPARSSASAAMTASIADDCLLSSAEAPAAAEARWLCSACSGVCPARDTHRVDLPLSS